MNNFIKTQLLGIAQTLMTLLLWLPSLLVMNSCKNLASQNLPIKEGKQEFLHTSEPSEVIVFLGNPGVGKSALCNSIFQKNVFKSGVSIGKGLTTEKQEYIYENRKYIDTPGLADVKQMEKSADEINKALKEDKNYKIVFVTTIDGGRGKSDDLETINAVCKAIKVPFEYGIIFNKVTKPVIKAMNNEGGLDSYLSKLSKQPSSILFIEKDQVMETEGNDAYLSFNSVQLTNLKSFISNLKAYKIPANKVQELEINSSELSEQLKAINEKLSITEEKLNKTRQTLSKQHKIVSTGVAVVTGLGVAGATVALAPATIPTAIIGATGTVVGSIAGKAYHTIMDPSKD